MSSALHKKVEGIVTRHHSQPDQHENRIRAIQGLSALQQMAETSAAGGGLGANDLSLLSSSAVASSSASLALHRSFRLLLQNRNVSVYRSLLAEFGSVAQEMKNLEASLDASSQLAAQLSEQLKDMKQRSNTLFQSTGQLTQQQAALESKKELVGIFLKKFQLDPVDAKILTETSESDVGEAFFAALEKITDIKRNIEQMLGGGGSATQSGDWQQPSQTTSPSATGNSLAGSNRISLDLLDSLSKQLDVAYEKLYRYIQSQLQNGFIIKTSDLSAKFITSFTLLRNIPVYYQHCLGDFISMRRSLLIERFLKALSRGTAGTRPIELSAHDPVRYTSDILAWIHQAVANEKEFLMTLFPNAAAQNSNPQQQGKPNSPSPDPSQPIVYEYQQYLSSIFEALSRPVSIRIEQSFTHASGGSSTSTTSAAVASSSSTATPSISATSTVTHTQIETVFKIWNILKFYAVIIQPILPQVKKPEGLISQENFPPPATAPGSTGPPSPTSAAANASTDLLSTLSILSDHARQAFFHLLSVAGSRLARGAQLTGDLSPAPVIAEWLAQLAAIMNIYNSSLVAPQEKEAEFEEIFERILAPLLQTIGLGPAAAGASSSSSSASPPADVDHLIYRINVLHAVLNVCFTFPAFVSKRIEAINALIAQQVEQLVEQQANSVWRSAGLDRTIHAAQHAANSGATNLRAQDAMNVASMTNGIKTFYTSLLSVGAFIVPQCDRLQHTPVRRHCRTSIAKLLSSQYRTLYNIVTSPTYGFDVDQMQGIFIHAPAHVDLLLDLQTTGTPMAQSRNV